MAVVWRNRRRDMVMPGLAADAARNIKQRYPLHEGGTPMTAGSGAVRGQCAPAISARRRRTSVRAHLCGASAKAISSPSDSGLAKTGNFRLA